jgi:hypothetical protein
MWFIPTYCDSCARVALVASEAIVGGMARCDECGGRSRSLPGESYVEGDIALFNDLRAALSEAGVTQANAAGLAAQLQVRNTEQPGVGLRRLAHLVPALGILELIVVNQPGALRKAEGMLATLLGAVASGRRPSGWISRQGTFEEKAGGN